MSWKGIVNVAFPSHLQTLMALFPKSKVLKGLVSRSVNVQARYRSWFWYLTSSGRYGTSPHQVVMVPHLIRSFWYLTSSGRFGTSPHQVVMVPHLIRSLWYLTSSYLWYLTSSGRFGTSPHQVVMVRILWHLEALHIHGLPSA